jgi:hypothetical protein
MSFFPSKASAFQRSTSHTYRGHGGVAEVREVSDKTARISVVAFPMALVPEIVSSEAAVAACYILADHDTIYIGETNNVGRRLDEHLLDPTKTFCREVFVIRGVEAPRFSKEDASYLQYHLTQIAEQVGYMTVLKGATPRLPTFELLEEPALERLLHDSQRLLFDAGLRCFASNCGKADAAHPDDEIPPLRAMPEADAEDAGQMEIGVDLPRAGVAEYELSYGDNIWARGYHAGGRFVVAAGSEFRLTTNPSTVAINRTRREVVIAAGVLAPISGVNDRRRLTVDIAFSSMAIAAKIVCGAHVDSSKWQPLDMAQRQVMTL